MFEIKVETEFVREILC